MGKVSKAQSQAVNRYTAKNYDRLYPFVPKGRKVEIQVAADAQGESLNDFIVKAIDERMKRLGHIEKPFTPPPGEWCQNDCPKRGEMFPAIEVGKLPKHEYDEGGYPWCFEYGVEITDRDGETGKYRKCESCLNNKKPPQPQQERQNKE